MTTAMRESDEGLYTANHASVAGQPQRRPEPAHPRHPTHPEIADAQILTPTFLERWAVRRRLPSSHPVWTGVRLARWNGARTGAIVVVCGLAGALAPSLRPGSVVVPEWVGRPDGTILRCDADLTRELIEGATALGYQPETGPLLTAPTLVTGSERELWARRGYIAADMETGLLADQGLRVATVRVILDGVRNPISAQWLTPLLALLRPGMWRDLWWLSRAGPAFSLRAAEVLEAACQRFAAAQP
ncbi:MAG TPA: hypothetical protein VFQ32_13855 [Ktedonobacterales bacterium]|nr:hypothetical protein [Ktedonobacterales bacterium]